MLPVLSDIHTDLTITTEKLKELFAPLDPGKVDRLGGEGYLYLPLSEIDRIQKDYQTPSQRKEAYLDLYVHQHPCPTWNEVARILRYEVYLHQQADLVENTYVKGTQDTHCSEAVVCASIINTACVVIGSHRLYSLYHACMHTVIREILLKNFVLREVTNFFT